MTERWFPAVWLGTRFNTGEHIVSRLDGGAVVRCRSIQELGREITFEEVEAIRGRPWMPTGTVPLTAKTADVARAEPVSPSGPPPMGFQPRSVYITRDILERVGYTKGCVKNRAVARGEARGGGHSRECRMEVEKKLESDVELKRKLDDAEERKTRFLAEEVERSEKLARQEVLAPEQPTLKRKAEDQLDASRAEAEEFDVPVATHENLNGQGGDSSSASAASAPMATDLAPDCGAKRGLVEMGSEDEPPTTKTRLSLGLMAVHDVNVEGESDNATDMDWGTPIDFNPVYDDWIPGRHEPGGEGFDPRLVEAAQREELARFQRMGVFRHVTDAEVDATPESTIVGTRWVITDKGSDGKPVMKARLVAQEFATKEGRGELFAGTPGLRTIKQVLSNLATDNQAGRRIAMVLDVKTAFLYAEVKRKVFIRLPPEACLGEMTHGVLKRAMYGTRDAPLLWQQHLTDTLTRMKFQESPTNAGYYFNKERNVEIVAHVDDLLITGAKADLDWTYAQLTREYELKRNFLGPGYEDQVSYLGRTLKWTPQGLTWIHNAKHVKNLLNMYGMVECKGMSTPMVHEEFARDMRQDESELLGSADARRYRAGAATVNYLSQDRPDLAVASCALARSMAAPRAGDVPRLKRVIRYLQQHPVGEHHFVWQEASQALTLWTDSDWASCRATRRSCSGGVLFRGAHMIGHWCRLQNQVSLSSGEAELYAGNRGLCEMAGALVLYREVHGEAWGLLTHCLDSNASRTFLLRKGTGSMKHIETKAMWGQQFVRAKGVKVLKVPREANCADALASPCSAADLEKHLGAMGFWTP